MCSVAVQQKEAFNKDYEFGRSAEVSILDTIRRFFNDTTITPSTDKYSRYDYTGATAKYELKTRRLTRNRFATTMLPNIPTDYFTYPTTKKPLAISRLRPIADKIG